MLYQLYETQRAIFSPLADYAKASSKFFSNQNSPFASYPSSQRFVAGLDLTHRLLKDYEKPEFDIHQVNIDECPVVIGQRVEIDTPFCKLIRFKRFTDDEQLLKKLKNSPSVLIVAPLSGHHATLLRDTVRTMLESHKVYITEWQNARMVETHKGEFHLNDYVEFVQQCIRHIGPDVHVVSVCQPTVPVMAAVSLMAGRGEALPRSLVMMGGPIDARRNPTRVNCLAMNRSIEWFANNLIYNVPINYPGAGRKVYPGFLQHHGFIAMNANRHMFSHYEYFMHLTRGDDDDAEAHRAFYDEYNAVLDMDAPYYLSTIETVFQRFALVNGGWFVDGEEVDPSKIKKTALLTIEGELDDISGAGQTHAAHDICSNVPVTKKAQITAQGAGHYGIFSGKRWRNTIYPKVKAFIQAHR